MISFFTPQALSDFVFAYEFLELLGFVELAFVEFVGSRCILKGLEEDIRFRIFLWNFREGVDICLFHGLAHFGAHNEYIVEHCVVVVRGQGFIIRDFLGEDPIGLGIYFVVSMLIFTLMHWPCSTSVLTVHKETGSLKWTLLSVAVPTAAGFVLCTLFNLTVKLVLHFA